MANKIRATLKIPTIGFLSLIILIMMAMPVFSQIQFIENKGQWNDQVKFQSDAGNGTVFLEEKGYTVNMYDKESTVQMQRVAHPTGENSLKRTEPVTIKGHAYKVIFVNANPSEIIPEKPIKTRSNYFIGNDPKKWATDVHTYRVVTYKDMYPGIDVQYFMDEGENLKYDLIVHPGANVHDIAIQYEGVEKLSVKKQELIIHTPVGNNKSLRPFTYQPSENGRNNINCKYVVKDSIVTFDVGEYDASKPLVIDPAQIFFTYSGSTIDNYGFTATYGPDGSFFGGGIAWGKGFPINPGATQTQFGGGQFDIGIIKLTPNGSDRVYATYIGGRGADQPHSLIADSRGNLIIAGRSNSDNYPGTLHGPGGDYDIIVTKLNATGSAILGSVKIGGSGRDGVNINTNSFSTGQGTASLNRNYGDDGRSEVVLDEQENIYVASSTSSSNFPTVNPIQSTHGGRQDAVLIKLDPSCQNILFSTYIGGKDDDAGYVVVPGKDNNVYIAGATLSNDIPGIPSSNVIQPNNKGSIDGFVVELSADGSSYRSGTYAGTSTIDEIYGLDIDNNGYPYIMGTSHGDMPVINATYHDEGAKQFIWKMEKDLSKIIYATVYGSKGANVPNISPTAFMVDRCENVYVSGWGGKANTGFSQGSVKGMPTAGTGQIKPDADQTGSDFHFFVMEKDAQGQLYGTFFGQNDAIGVSSYGDHVDGGTSRFDPRGYIYQTMCVEKIPGSPFNGTFGSWSPINQVGNNPVNDDGASRHGYSIGMLKIEMDFTGVRANLQVTMNGKVGDTIGCVPQTVIFSDRERTNHGQEFIWDYGDGTRDTTYYADKTDNFDPQEVTHFYGDVGVYNVMLIAIDPDQCVTHDTSYHTIRIGNNRVFPDFKANKLPPCENLSYRFTNTSSTQDGSPFHPNTFTWDFGDGAPTVTNSFNDMPEHTYESEGNYNVTLTISDTAFCNSPADTVQTIHISPTVTAAFEAPDAVCVPLPAAFKNNSIGGSEFHWDFGDGTTTVSESPSHIYTQPGTYEVKLVAIDSASCNIADSMTLEVIASSVPTASFNYLPTQPEENTFTQFSNTSVGATSYLWDFGDGDTSTESGPRHIFPETGTFTVTLTSTNEFGCADTAMRNVQSLIRPLLDVPNAFTPGRFGKNSSVGVEGFGIKEMKWVIYNRWGQKVFESENQRTRWDGRLNGTLLPMDVYTYTLKATLADGQAISKTGDITLIR